MNSMTGFGRASAQADGREATVELRSVNHRYLDISFRLPRVISFLEDVFRKEISQRLERGKVEVYVSYRNHREDKCSVQADTALAKDYVSALGEIAQALGMDSDATLSKIASFPNVVSVMENEEDTEAVTALIREALRGALDALCIMREDEGRSLGEDFRLKLGHIEAHVSEIETLAPQASQASSDKLMEKMKEYYESDESIRQRVVAEAALIADKHAIDEELVRLRSHIGQFTATLSEPGAVGRKMDFIVQEMNRETNTIGNKAQGTDIPAIVILCKSELEKLREQVQNIE